VILGQDFLQRFNPDISWRTGKVVINGDIANEEEYKKVRIDQQQQKKLNSSYLMNVPDMNKLNESEKDVFGRRMVSSHNEKETCKSGISHLSDAANRACAMEVSKVLNEFSDAFEEVTILPGFKAGFDFKIEFLTPSPAPAWKKPYRLSPDETEAMRNEIDRLLTLGFISPTSSDWAAPIVFAKKRHKDSKLRMCIDYRGLNSLTKPLKIIFVGTQVRWQICSSSDNSQIKS